MTVELTTVGIVGVCGGRTFTDAPQLFEVMDALDHPMLVVEGASDLANRQSQRKMGADYFAHVWCIKSGVPNVRMPALWTANGRRAGPMRNGSILEWFTLDLLLAFKGGPGTADMVSRCETLGIHVRKIDWH